MLSFYLPLNVIMKDYKIKFYCADPYGGFPDNNKFALQDSDFVASANLLQLFQWCRAQNSIFTGLPDLTMKFLTI